MSVLEVDLAGFLPRQRWFAGKGREIRKITIEVSVTLREGWPGLRLLILGVQFADGRVERYQVPLGTDRDGGAERLRDRHPEAVVRAGDGEVVYDAVHDPRLRPVFLDLLGRGATVDGIHFRPLDVPDLAGLAGSRVLQVEQSNSSLVYGERYILKLFRRLEVGENPELELTRALIAQGFTACPAPLAWIEGAGSTLGILQPFYSPAEEGWQLATERARAYLEGAGEEPGFVEEARALGELTAVMHADLAAALPTRPAEARDLEELRGRMSAQLDQAARAVPELAGWAQEIRAVFETACAGAAGAHLQRIHGDYHLGQVLRTRQGGRAGWVVLDFEGEPARCFSERRGLYSPLRDVAGMLRSLDYAAFYPLATGAVSGDGLEERAVDWVARQRAAFLEGYSSAGGAWLGGGPALLLNAFELDKAVYEVLYEVRHRPGWLPIPLGGIARLLRGPRAA